MALLSITSPHVKGPQRTANIMRWVILMTLPGLALQTYFFGWGNLHNVIWCCLIALAAESLVLWLRKRPIGFYIGDYSALVTAVLLGLALPPFAPWWVSLVACLFSILFAKHLYGGIGYNPFNPAMAGYALVLISYPLAMTTTWANPTANSTPSITETIAIIWELSPLIDAYTGATPLDVYKHEVSVSTAEEIRSNPIFGQGIAVGWEAINLAFMLGGLVLIGLKIMPWQTPVAVLVGLALPALVFGWDEDQSAPLSLHLFAGATMLGAFFIATDPVSSATTNLGRLIYGFGIGLLTYVIRVWGSYPDAIAFAVLLMNFAAPLIDVYTQPRAYGYKKANRGPKASNKP